jgi:hypothetical protein
MFVTPDLIYVNAIPGYHAYIIHLSPDRNVITWWAIPGTLMAE